MVLGLHVNGEGVTPAVLAEAGPPCQGQQVAEVQKVGKYEEGQLRDMGKPLPSSVRQVLDLAQVI